ncbi:MAG: hypothetical protein ABL873_01615 [Gallionella sp.]
MYKKIDVSANPFSLTLQILMARYVGQVLIPFSAAAKSAGFAEQTARNLQSQNIFPIRSRKIGSRRFVHISDLANYIEQQCPESEKQKPGRPTKFSKSRSGMSMEGN